MWSVSRVVPATVDEAWAPLVDLAAWPQWGPTVTGASLDDAEALGPGVRGHVRTLAGVRLPFVVTAFDDTGGVRRWAWSVGGVPATTHEVVALDQGTRVQFGVPTWAPGYLAVCALALRPPRPDAVGLTQALSRSVAQPSASVPRATLTPEWAGSPSSGSTEMSTTR